MSRVSPALAAVGVVVFTLALMIPTRSAARTMDRGSSASGYVDGTAVLAHPLRIASLPASPAAPPPPPPTPQPAVLAFQAMPSSGATVIASWYGPGFYGNRTACGQIYTPEIQGVAHKTLPCGTLLQLDFRGRVVTVPVIDRGPYIAGRTLDLSNATRAALGCTDLCPVGMQERR